jgi:hypothetical protein
MKPNNPFKSITFNSNWGKGDFTCVHTLKEPEGSWWRTNFNVEIMVTRVAILNRNDCCDKRLKGAKIFIGDNLFGSISDPLRGDWSVVKGRQEGKFLKIQGTPNTYLHFCGIKVWAIANEETCKPEPPAPIGGIFDDDTLEKTEPLKLNC